MFVFGPMAILVLGSFFILLRAVLRSLSLSLSLSRCLSLDLWRSLSLDLSLSFSERSFSRSLSLDLSLSLSERLLSLLDDLLSDFDFGLIGLRSVNASNKSLFLFFIGAALGLGFTVSKPPIISPKLGPLFFFSGSALEIFGILPKLDIIDGADLASTSSFIFFAVSLIFSLTDDSNLSLISVLL